MIPHRVFVVPEVLSSHVVPSEEVRIVPEVPTTTNVLFANATPQRSFDVPEVLDVQVIPSLEVRIDPESPTVINVLFPYVTALTP